MKINALLIVYLWVGILFSVKIHQDSITRKVIQKTIVEQIRSGEYKHYYRTSPDNKIWTKWIEVNDDTKYITSKEAIWVQWKMEALEHIVIGMVSIKGFYLEQ